MKIDTKRLKIKYLREKLNYHKKMITKLENEITNIHNFPARFECPFCHKAFYGEKELSNHKRSHPEFGVLVKKIREEILLVKKIREEI